MPALLAASLLLSAPSAQAPPERFLLRFLPKVGSRYEETQVNRMTLQDDAKPEGERVVGSATVTGIVGIRVLARSPNTGNGMGNGTTTLRTYIASIEGEDAGEAHGFVARARAVVGMVQDIRVSTRNLTVTDEKLPGAGGARIPFNEGPVSVGDSWEAEIGAVPPLPIRVTFAALLTAKGRRYAALKLAPAGKSEVGIMRFDPGGYGLVDVEDGRMVRSLLPLSVSAGVQKYVRFLNRTSLPGAPEEAEILAALKGAS